MANKKIRMKVNNGAGYDTLYPQTTDENVLCDSGTTTLDAKLLSMAGGASTKQVNNLKRKIRMGGLV